MAETLSSPDRELNFLQFGGDGHTSSSKSEITLTGFSNEIVQNSNIEFSIKLSNPDFNCGDLYITIYDTSSSEKQVLTQSGFLKQCFIQKLEISKLKIVVENLESKSGEIIVSASKAKKIEGWNKLLDKYEKNEVIKIING